MRAVVLSEFGEPSTVLSVHDVEPPTPGRGEVRVRMLASPVNPSDLMVVRGIYGMLPELPATPGFEGVGIVEESGGGLLGGIMKGRRVAVLNRGGGNWAEQVVLPANQVVPLPKELSNEQAAMFFVNPATAYVMTRETLAVPQGAWLLQTAAASALGRMVIRLGREYGFKTLNIVRRQSQVDELKSLGADEVIVFDADHDPPDALTAQLRSLTGQDGVRYAIDPVGGVLGGAVVASLAVGGHLLIYGTLAQSDISFSPRHLLSQTTKIEGFWLSRHMQSLGLLGRIGLVRKITGLIQRGLLAAEAEHTYPLDQITEAVAKSEEPNRGGKVVLTMEG